VAIPRIVMDTNVLVSAIRSNKGASYKFLTMVDSGKYELQISVPLLLEYEEAAKRSTGIALSETEINDILDYICAMSNKREIFYLWRPMLKDPKDDFVLELAVESESAFIITYNKQDFGKAERFGIRVATPKEFLEEIGVIR